MLTPLWGEARPVQNSEGEGVGYGRCFEARASRSTGKLDSMAASQTAHQSPHLGWGTYGHQHWPALVPGAALKVWMDRAALHSAGRMV